MGDSDIATLMIPQGPKLCQGSGVPGGPRIFLGMPRAGF